MLAEALVSYLHYFGFMTLFAALVAQHLFFVTSATVQQIQRLFVLDGLYGLAATLVLFSGLAKVFWVGKPAAVYMQNGFFHMKVSLFLAVALLSIWPSIKFFKTRRIAMSSPATALIQLPAGIRVIQRIELIAVVTIPLLAVFMTRA